ncbi:hypothetical protein P3T73_01780 [Kiritimatiellota bacterium B12222]|nr:hypothetical protein P3T73_01780 [Kiritimatiellota bacterium B12222]
MILNIPKGLFATPLQKTLALLLIALTGMLLITLVVQQVGFPEPTIQDEFAYLLGADTFLEGRLTNPTPPLSEFFESYHVNLTPTYHSKYPPGQSAFLALGKLIFGREIYGVWLSFILAAVAVVWALQAVFPARWSILGGLLAIANSTLLLKWAFSFWGGSVAMLGGALLMGGMLRLYQNPRISAAVWASCGLFIMAFSRPLEGLLTAGMLLLFYVGSLVKTERDFSKIKQSYRVGAIFVITGLLIFGLNLVYNKTLTGSVFTFPHMNWNPRESAHEIIRAYQGSESYTLFFKLNRFFAVFIGPFLWIPVLLVFRRIRDPRILAAMVTLLFVSIYSATTSRAWPHYIAPIIPILIGLQIAGCRMLCRWKVGTTHLGFILFALLLVLHFGDEFKSFTIQSGQINYQAFREQGAMFKRDVDEIFAEKSGKHLLFVRYLEGHKNHWEYVYNRADIPSAKVIWAREMSLEENRQLIETYSDRQIWVLLIQNFSVEMIEIKRPES